MQVLNFTMKFNNKIELPICVWGEDIDRIKPFIIINHILHIYSPYARPQPQSRWTNGRDFILTCRNNTLVNTLGKIQSDLQDNKRLREFDNIQSCVDNVSNNDEEIVLIACMKTEFRKENDKSSKRIDNVTDGLQKITTYVCDFYKNDQFEKGQRIKMMGKLILMPNKIYFEVSNSEDIQKLDGERLPQKVLQGILKTPKRRSPNKENSSQDANTSIEEKKSKLNKENLH